MFFLVFNVHPKVLLQKLIFHKEMVVLWIAGLIIIGCVDLLNTQKLEHQHKYQQDLMAQQLQARLQSTLEEHVTSLTALSVVYQNFVDINHYDFQQYGKSMTANLKGFRRLLYVSPSENIERIYPLNGENARLLGMTLRSTSPYHQLLQEARQSHKPMTSNLLTFMLHQDSFLAIMPIYRNQSEFIGYAVGEISLAEIWEPISHAAFLKHYLIQLKDPSGRPFFQSVDFKTKDRILTQLTFRVGEQRWTMLLESVQSTSEIVILQRFITWFVGLLILSLVMMLITGSRKFRQTLGQAQKQFETVFQASPDGILMLDDQLRFKLTNPPVSEWSGYSPEQLANKRFFDVFACQCPHLKKCRELSYLLCTSDQFQEELPDPLETQLTHCHDDTIRTFRLNASKVQHGQDPASGFICVLGDISTIKELARIKETYVATLTHDLKTPLIAQSMVLESVLAGKSGPVTEAQQKLLSGAAGSVKDLLDMVNSTLLYYQLESSHLVLQKQPASAETLVREVMDALMPLLKSRELVFELQAGVKLPETVMDSIQMKRVFHNLLSNAIHYASKGTRIQVIITASEEQNTLEICIINEGKGIPPEELPKVFDRYYSLSRRFKRIGTGLGLYISRRIVELHDGKIWAESDPDKETRFYVALPCLQPTGALVS